MRVIGDKNQISEDVFDFMISNLPFPQKSIRSELAKLFFPSVYLSSANLSNVLHALKYSPHFQHFGLLLYISAFNSVPDVKILD